MAGEKAGRSQGRGSRSEFSGWTNESVRLLAGDRDPVQAVVEKIREKIVAALDAGWSGPPFDPVELATRHLKLSVVPTGDVREARTVPVGNSARIEFNPTRPRERRRFSIAHEIAHTLFPDYAARVRHRGPGDATPPAADDWQLEALCNIAAAEILMPIGSLPPTSRKSLTVDHLSSQRPRYDVSMEAVLIRAVRMADFPCAMWAASRVESGPSNGRYRVDYLLASHGWRPPLRAHSLLQADTVVAECTAIGFTAKGPETWGNERVHVESVGIPSYPWSIYPRVAGVISPLHGHSDEGESSRARYLVGDALAPRGSGPKVLAHVVNDKTPNWGGGGFAAAIKREMPEVQHSFRQWATATRGSLRLGNVHVAPRGGDLWVASMVAQHSYGEATGERRIRYAALEACLDQLATHATKHGATVHMPRIGTGQGGAAWPVVHEMLNRALCDRGIDVTIYDLPNATKGPQLPLDFAAS